MPFHDLPNEILLEINNNLGCANHRSMLARTSRGLYHLLYRPLYQYNIDHQHCSGLIWSVRHLKIAKNIFFLGLPRVNVNSRDQKEQTSLHVAAMQDDGHYMVRILVTQEGINFNAVDKFGRTPLYDAVLSENIFSLQMLLGRYDIDVNFPDSRGFTPLHHAVMTENKPAVKKLLADQRTLPNKQAKLGRAFPLTFAATGGDPEMLSIFLRAARTDINSRCRGGLIAPFPLATALTNKHESFSLRMLHAPGLDLNEIHALGMTPLQLGIHFDQMKFVHELLSRPGIELNRQGTDGKTAVMTAALNKNTTALKILLAKLEVDVSIQCGRGYTVLDYAKGCNDTEILSIVKPSGRFG